MMQNTSFTYNGVVHQIELFANAYGGIRFIADDEEQISELTSKGEAFPVMALTPLYNYYGDTMNDYSFRIYVYDRLLKDKSNNITAKSDCDRILNDLVVYIRRSRNLPFEIDDDTIVTATPIISEMMTDVTGWYADITVSSPSYPICDIPFIEP